MAKHLEFLLAIDTHLRKEPLGYISRGFDMYAIATDAGLAAWGDEGPATWTGELIEAGYLTHGPPGLGDRRPIVRGAMWGRAELQRFHDYRITHAGREEADRTRRIARETATDGALDPRRATLVQPWMDTEQRRAIEDPLLCLRTALDAEQWSAAVGAAKDLAEAACKLVIHRSNGQPPANASLPALFKQAHRASTPDVDEQTATSGAASRASPSAWPSSATRLAPVTATRRSRRPLRATRALQRQRAPLSRTSCSAAGSRYTNSKPSLPPICRKRDLRRDRSGQT